MRTLRDLFEFTKTTSVDEIGYSTYVNEDFPEMKYRIESNRREVTVCYQETPVLKIVFIDGCALMCAMEGNIPVYQGYRTVPLCSELEEIFKLPPGHLMVETQLRKSHLGYVFLKASGREEVNISAENRAVADILENIKNHFDNTEYDSYIEWYKEALDKAIQIILK